MIRIKDQKLPWDTTKILSFEEFSKTYKLEEIYKESGQGAIYYVTKNGVKNCCMAKVFKDCDQNMIDRIYQEYMLMYQIRIFHYGKIAFGENKNDIYITMEALRYTLSAAVKHDINENIHNFHFRKSINDDQYLGLRYFIAEIASVLYQLHQRNYVHQDIKPSNMMFRNHKNESALYIGNGFKLIDYSMMRYLGENNKSLKLPHYEGTKGYSSPEMTPFADKHKPNIVTTKSDIWSFAVCLLFIINKGRNIFKVTDEEIKRHQLKDDGDKYLTYWYSKTLQGDNEDGMGQSFIDDHIMDLYLDDKIDGDLSDLLSNIFKYDPVQRLSAMEILQHDFLEPIILQKNNKMYLKINKLLHRDESRRKCDYVPICLNVANDS